MKKKTLCDAVAHLVVYKGMPESRIAKEGVTREDVRNILDGNYVRISDETITKVKNNLGISDEEILRNALRYRTQSACNSIFRLLMDSDRTDEDTDEMAEFMKDYIDELIELRKRHS